MNDMLSSIALKKKEKVNKSLYFTLIPPLGIPLFLDVLDRVLPENSSISWIIVVCVAIVCFIANIVNIISCIRLNKKALHVISVISLILSILIVLIGLLVILLIVINEMEL